jgi:uncharacterized protein involved in exopolysaccharide biosynthesis
VALDAKTDTSVSSQRLDLLERELENLKERVRATERLIQDVENLIASSKQEAKDLTIELKIELAELSTLSRQIVFVKTRMMKQQSKKPTVSVLKP